MVGRILRLFLETWDLVSTRRVGQPTTMWVFSLVKQSRCKPLDNLFSLERWNRRAYLSNVFRSMWLEWFINFYQFLLNTSSYVQDITYIVPFLLNTFTNLDGNKVLLLLLTLSYLKLDKTNIFVASTVNCWDIIFCIYGVFDFFNW